MPLLTMKLKPVVESPNYAMLEGYETLGGVIALCSPRRLTACDNASLCEGRGAGVFVPFFIYGYKLHITAGLKSTAFYF